MPHTYLAALAEQARLEEDRRRVLIDSFMQKAALSETKDSTTVIREQAKGTHTHSFHGDAISVLLMHIR